MSKALEQPTADFTFPKPEQGSKKGWQLSVAAAGLVVGVLIALQIRTQWQLSQMAPDGGRRFNLPMRANVLAERLLDAQEELKKANRELEELKRRLAEYEHHAVQGKSLLQDLNRRLRQAELLAGLTPLKGRGVIVRLDDAPRKENLEEGDASFFLVHDLDLLRLVNELKAAHAEAIYINDQRIIATSEIRCSGNNILVNGNPVVPPYEIGAIGDPNVLMKALTMPKGIIDEFKLMNFDVKIMPRDEIIVPSLPLTPSFKYSRPVGGNSFKLSEGE